MEVAQANGIEAPVNGSWIQAICESLGIMSTVNGSWIQALAQYGPFGVTPLANPSTFENFLISDYQAGAGPKGTDLYSFVFDILVDTLEENCIMIITDNNFGFNVDSGFGFTNYVATFAGAESGRTISRVNAAVNGTPTYTIETQIVDTVSGRVSPINSFEYTLAPPTP